MVGEAEKPRTKGSLKNAASSENALALAKNLELSQTMYAMFLLVL